MSRVTQSQSSQVRTIHGAVLARLLPGSLLALAILVPALRAQEEFDSYKIRFDGDWIYSNPSGNIQGSSDRVPVDVNRDFQFNSYSTFLFKADWKFTRKNHFYVVVGRFDQSRETQLSRTITFQNQTFSAGAITHVSLNYNVYSPGYQYDIIRRRRGHLGIAVQMNVADTTGKITAAAQVTSNGVLQAARSAQGSLTAPLPVAGPEFRLYLFNSPRLFVEANAYGMYFGGYGNFVSSRGAVGVAVTKHISLKGGYALASRLEINNKSSSKRIGVRLTERGAQAGLEFSF